jgi:hypothetical protein
VLPLLWVALVVIAGWSATFRVREIEWALRGRSTTRVDAGPFRSTLLAGGDAALSTRARRLLWGGCAALAFVGATALWLLVANAHEFNRAPEVHAYLDGAGRAQIVAATRAGALARAALDALVFVGCVLAHRRFVARVLGAKGALLAAG